MPRGRQALVRGMHGLCDNLHQRAIVRELMARGEEPLAGDAVAVHLPRPGRAATQPAQQGLAPAHPGQERGARGGALCRRRRAPARVPADRPVLTDGVLAAGSVLAAMCSECSVGIERVDFRLPVPEAWLAKARDWIDRWRPPRPLLVYRPLNERSEWGGCRVRNPDFAAYASLLSTVRDRYFVVSVADFEPGKEWMVGIDVKPDVALHHDELDVETLAGLTRLSALVWTSPGFLVILAQAVGTPSVCVFGGYEDGRSFSAGARFAPHLAIEPINPCPCFRHDCPCDKQIAFAEAAERLAVFVAAADRRRSAA